VTVDLAWVAVDLAWVAVVLRFVAVNLSLPHTNSILLTRTKVYGYKLISGYNNGELIIRYNNTELKTCHNFSCAPML
jgi:hypothetical protein